MREAVIFDMDGTLCDVRSIRHLVDVPGAESRVRPNFHEFHSQSFHCPPFPLVVDLLNRARKERLAIIVVTGREKRWSFLTSRWLSEHEIEYDELKMRPDGDFRPDHLIKAEIQQSLSWAYRILLAIDDRRDIAQVWQRAGIPTSLVSGSGQLAELEWPPSHRSRTSPVWFSAT